MAQVVHDETKDSSPQEVLHRISLLINDSKNRPVGLFPNQRIDGDDRRGKGRRPPVRRQVDDARRESRVEENIRGQVTVNELFFRAERLQPLRNLSDGRQRAKRSKACVVPGSPVGLSEDIHPLGKEPWPRNICGRAVDSLTDRADLGPASCEMLAFEALPSHPAFNDKASVCGAHGPGQTKPDVTYVGENLFLPDHLLARHVQGLQHQLSSTPCSPLTARKWLQRLIDVERGQKPAGRAGAHPAIMDA